MANFVNGKELYRMVCEFQDNSSANDRIYGKIANEYIKMVRRWLMKSQYNKYDENRKCEMVSTACYNFCKQGINGFNREISQNVFSYFTQIIKNSIFQTLNNYRDSEEKESVVTYIEEFDNPSDVIKHESNTLSDGDYENVQTNAILFNEEENAICRAKNWIRMNRVPDPLKASELEIYYYELFSGKELT